ncbi:glycosyltransferase [Anaeromusa sp.]|uniref:glycosyltransferase family protein n=1 Tax=Anaeromusa sp. TaxID=1872520 RepID=UPI00262BA4C6|nr:glycosyltransferase [Anaeromusa sp.]MDD3157104.1 glycosyltransferase [Anaeromusa sp.]
MLEPGWENAAIYAIPSHAERIGLVGPFSMQARLLYAAIHPLADVAVVESLEALEREAAQKPFQCVVVWSQGRHDREKLLGRIVASICPGGVVLLLAANPRYWRRLQSLLTQGASEAEDVSPERWTAWGAAQGLLCSNVRPLVGNEPVPEAALLARALAEKTPLEWLAAPVYLWCGVKTRRLPPQMVVQTLLISRIASDTVRVYEPDRALAALPGVDTISSLDEVKLLPQEDARQKIFVWQRSRLTKKEGPAKQKALLQRGYVPITEIDDDPMYWPEHPQEEFITFRSSLAVQTSTEPLAAYLRQFNPFVRFFPNQLAWLPPWKRRVPAGSVRIFFGAFNREADWKPILPALNALLTQWGGKVHMQVLYDEAFYKALQTPYKTFEPLCPYERYHEVVRQADVALLPLNDTRFNRMKSDLKFLQCAAHGVAVLASPTVYAESICEGETGFLFATPEEFSRKLECLVLDAERRRRMAEQAYGWVRERRMLWQHYRTRYAWYMELAGRRQELVAALRQRLPDMFE